MQGANTAELAAVKDVAAEAVADFIRFPELFQFDLLEAEAVAQLQNDKQHGPLHEILTMLLTSSSVKVRYILMVGSVFCGSAGTACSVKALQIQMNITSLPDTSLCMQGLEAFSKQHGDVLKSIGVSYEDILAKGRILALLSLASQFQVLSFAAIRVS